MAFGAHFNVQRTERGTRLERIAAGTGDHAAPILGMNSGFHIDNLSLNRKLTSYQPRRCRTIARWLSLLTCALPLICASAQPAGFAPSSQNLLTPLLSLAPCGQAEQALRAFERIHRLDRAIMLHPLLSRQLQSLID